MRRYEMATPEHVIARHPYDQGIAYDRGIAVVRGIADGPEIADDRGYGQGIADDPEIADDQGIATRQGGARQQAVNMRCSELWHTEYCYSIAVPREWYKT